MRPPGCLRAGQTWRLYEGRIQRHYRFPRAMGKQIGKYAIMARQEQ
jgi:hypothetical protein